MNDDETLLFLHVPKAAGTTLRGILDQQFPPDAICPAYYMRELLSYSRRQLQRYRFVRGHYDYSVGELVQNPRYITVLREPVSRAFSFYTFVRSMTQHPWHAAFNTMPLARILRDDQYRRSLANHQTALFGRDVDLKKMRQNILGLDPAEDDFPSIAGTEPNLELAKERLGNFIFVGVSDLFDDSLLLMAEACGWPPVENYEVRNVTERAESVGSLSESLVDMIRETNRDDQELYEYARTLVEERLRELCRRTGEALDKPIDQVRREDSFRFLKQAHG